MAGVLVLAINTASLGQSRKLGLGRCCHFSMYHLENGFVKRIVLTDANSLASKIITIT